MPEREPGKGRVLRLAECSRAEADEAPAAASKAGCGEPLLAQALGDAACRKPVATRYVRFADLCPGPSRARIADEGSRFSLMDRCGSVRLLIIDDFLTTPIATESSVDLFGILKAREGRRATLIASQLEPNERRLRIEGELIAGSILGRVASASRRLDLDGPNMRKWLSDNRSSMVQ